jgi:hypothetical protein
MAKRESTFFNMVLALFVITFVASSLLGFIYELTIEPIELARAVKKNEAISSVVPAFDNNPSEGENTALNCRGRPGFLSCHERWRTCRNCRGNLHPQRV